MIEPRALGDRAGNSGDGDQPIISGTNFNNFGFLDMRLNMKPIGFIHTEAEQIPRHWTLSDVEGTLHIDERYLAGLKDIEAGQQIVVIFHFHRSPVFTQQSLTQKPPHLNKELGVFSICSPLRPNPIGMSVLEVLRIDRNILYVKGIDMLDGTPVLDIKPCVTDKISCHSYTNGKRKYK